jgi:C1A family cysteine protease
MEYKRYGAMGWERDLPDFRDYTRDTPQVQGVLDKSKAMKAAKKAVPAKVDLREWCSSIEDQGQLGSCTANAGVGVFEYFQRRAFGKYLDGSRLFLYKTTRNLLGWTGDEGAYLRTTMQAMALFGVPPEKHWPYNIARFDEEPPNFCYAYAQNYQAVKYFRLDKAGMPTATVLQHIKENLAAKLPCMFGFSVYSSMPGVEDETGDIPFPGPDDRLEGGHAVVAVGYDDTKKIGPDRGALLIRNSWGTEWGENGYGYLPYSYVLKGVAVDFWSLITAEYFDSDLFREDGDS